MARFLGFSLGLDAAPTVQDEKLFGEFVRLYNAINALASLLSPALTEATRRSTVTEVSDNTTLTDLHGTVVMTVSGKTVTLPAATTARIGMDWTVILDVAGTCDITVAGAETIRTGGGVATYTLNVMGQSATLRCLSTTKWGLV